MTFCKVYFNTGLIILQMMTQFKKYLTCDYSESRFIIEQHFNLVLFSVKYNKYL